MTPTFLARTSPGPHLSFIYALSALIAVTSATGLECSRTADAPVASASGDWRRYHDRSFSVTRVVDGDTLDINIPDGDKPVTRIRLWGVDTPETFGPSAPMHFGKEASLFAKNTLENRMVHIVLSPKDTRGTFGRLLAYVFLTRGGRMFNEILLEKGYAYADLRFPHDHFERFKAIEKQIRKRGLGLWNDITLEKMPQWKQRFEKRAAKGTEP